MITCLLVMTDQTSQAVDLPEVPRFSDHLAIHGSEFVVGGVRWYIEGDIQVEVHLQEVPS